MDGNSFFNLGNLIAGILTIGIISFLYKDNPLYKFCESLFVGVSAGYWFVTIVFTVILPKLYDKLVSKEYIYLVGGALGVLMLFRLIPKVSWLANWSLAFVVGSTAGVNLIGYMQSNGMNQVKFRILFLMITFGAAFGYTVMSRMSLLIGRMDFFFGSWMGLVR